MEKKFISLEDEGYIYICRYIINIVIWMFVLVYIVGYYFFIGMWIYGVIIDVVLIVKVILL